MRKRTLIVIALIGWGLALYQLAPGALFTIIFVFVIIAGTHLMQLNGKERATAHAFAQAFNPITRKWWKVDLKTGRSTEYSDRPFPDVPEYRGLKEGLGPVPQQCCNCHSVLTEVWEAESGQRCPVCGWPLDTVVVPNPDLPSPV